VAKIMHRSPKIRIAVLATVGSLVLAVSGYAATIVGTAHNDTLRGSPKADVIRGAAGNDKLYGLAGNDKLYGGKGNDLLVGGRGADSLNCGPGRDVAVADARDTVSSNCEVVKGLATTTTTSTATTTTTTTPTTTTTTPTTTTTAAPPAAMAEAGRYCGFTNNGSSICFTVTAAPQLFTNAHFGVNVVCNPGPTGFTITVDTGGAAPLQPDLSFTWTDSSTDELAGTVVTGTLDTSGHAKGHLRLSAAFTDGGTAYSCGVETDWTAQIQL